MSKRTKAAALLLTAVMLISLLSGCFSQVSNIEFKEDGSVVFGSTQYVLEQGLKDNNLTPGEYFNEPLKEGAQLESIEIKGNTYWGAVFEPVTYDSLNDFITAMEGNSLIDVYESGGLLIIDYKVESITFRSEEQSEDGSIDLVPEKYQPMMVDELRIVFPGGLSGLEYPPENKDLIYWSKEDGAITLDLNLSDEEYHVKIAGRLEAEPQGSPVESFDIKIEMPEPGVKTGNLVIDPPDCQPEGSCGVDRIDDRYFTWYLNDGSEDWKKLDYDDEFEAGKQYGVRFAIYPGQGYYFDPAVTEIIVNGKHPNRIDESEDGNTLIISYVFDPLSDEGDERIVSVDLSMSEVKVGMRTGDIVLSLADADPGQSCSIAINDKGKPSVTWWCDEGGEEWARMDDKNDVLEAGKKYGVNVDLAAAEGYYFDEGNTAVSINGKDPSHVGFESSCFIYVSYDFKLKESEKPKEKTVPFTDVSKSDYFYDSVVWAFNAEPQITDGTSATTFSPAKTCTRGQVVTFLWRSQGCPEPKNKNNPFSDVSESDYFYKPVLWAVENGITDGTSPTTFSPASTCKNSHILTFIFRAAGEMDTTGGQWWEEPLHWADEKGILKNTGVGEVNISGDCPRKNVVQFLYQLTD